MRLIRLIILWRIMEIEEGVIRRGRVTKAEFNNCFIQNNSYLYRSVKFLFDSAGLGLFSSANILQIADVALWLVFLLFLPCF